MYKTIFPEAGNPEKRFEAYAKNLGILTEYWRVHRKCAAVMHFCGLGYSRPDPPLGQTSDNFIDISVPVHMINDTSEDWKGNMRLYISAGDETNIEEKGEYKLVAEIIYRGESVKSIRDFAVQ